MTRPGRLIPATSAEIMRSCASDTSTRVTGGASTPNWRLLGLRQTSGSRGSIRSTIVE